MKRTLLGVAVLGAFLTGCTGNSSDGSSGTNVTEFARTSSVNYVCIGMETSARFGSCPGCQLDSNRMSAFLKDTFGYSGVLLQSEQATRANVAKAIAQGVQKTPANGLFILYYSGHGGQENLSDWDTSEPEGADTADEYLCLYDTYLLDDEIWKLISSCKGRLFLCFDACHSQTMFRSVKSDIAEERGLALPLGLYQVKSRGFLLKPRAMSLEAGTFNMLCWSGCLEKEYSYGSKRGGVMTNALLSRWDNGISYTDLWNLIIADVKRQQPTQHPYATTYGSGFGEAFR